MAATSHKPALLPLPGPPLAVTVPSPACIVSLHTPLSAGASRGDPSPASRRGHPLVGAIPAEPCRDEFHWVPLVSRMVWPKPILLQCNEWKRGESITMV